MSDVTKLTAFEIVEIETLAYNILKILKKHPANNQICYKACLQVLDSLIVSSAKDDACMRLLIQDAKEHLDGLLENPLEDWRKEGWMVKDDR